MDYSYDSLYDDKGRRNAGWTEAKEIAGGVAGNANGGKGVKVDGKTWYVDVGSGAEKPAGSPGDPYESGYVESGGSGTKGNSGSQDKAEMQDMPGVSAEYLNDAKTQFKELAKKVQKPFDDLNRKGPPHPTASIDFKVESIRLHIDFSTYLQVCGTFMYQIDWSEDIDYDVDNDSFSYTLKVVRQGTMSDVYMDRDKNGNPGSKDVARTTFEKNGPQ